MKFLKSFAPIESLFTKKVDDSEESESEPEGPQKFGMFQGVFTPMVIIILCMMYLRQPWVVGNAGVLGAILILCLAELLPLKHNKSQNNAPSGPGAAENASLN